MRGGRQRVTVGAELALVATLPTGGISEGQRGRIALYKAASNLIDPETNERIRMQTDGGSNARGSG
jgi:hypothetical protein